MRIQTVRTVRSVWTALRALIVLAVILGIIYPAAVWAAGRVVPNRADGSLIYSSDGKAVGSKLIGQAVTDDRLFYPRPSAAGADNAANTGDDGYDAMSSGASNLAPTSEDLADQIETRRKVIAQRDGVDPQSIPADALTASGSGLDPHISPEYAAQQVSRVAEKTGLGEDTVRELVTQNTENPPLGFLGQPVVNTVTLNAAVIAAAGIEPQGR